MRTMLKITIPVDKGNEAFRSGDLQRTLQATLEALKPEAAYFFPDPITGCRTALLVFDMEGSWQIPPVAEPLFEKLGAAIQMTPVMNGEDLMRGLQVAAA